MTRGEGLKDRGHYGRKAVFWSYALGTCLFYFAFYGAGLLAERMVGVSSALVRWSHPCLYAPRPKEPAPELAPEWQARIPRDGRGAR